MPWQDQNPPAEDVVLALRMPERPYLRAGTVEVDRLPDGDYRVTSGNLFGSEEIGRGDDLEAIMRNLNTLMWAETKAAAMAAHKALTEMGDSPAPRM